MKLTPVILLLSLLCSAPLHAQMERTIYQVFPVDSVETVELDLAGIYEVQPWAGSDILVETNIQIWHASPEILKHLIELGRYDLVSDTLSPELIKISTKIRDRKPIKTRQGECTEIATTRLFVPEMYAITEDKKALHLRK